MNTVKRWLVDFVLFAIFALVLTLLIILLIPSAAVFTKVSTAAIIAFSIGSRISVLKTPYEWLLGKLGIDPAN